MPVETVTDRVYYHLNSVASMSPHALMQPGDVIQIGVSSNPFFRYYDVKAQTFPITYAPDTVQVPALEYFKRVKDGNATPGNFLGFAAEAHQAVEHFQILARELVWEEVRRAVPGDAPSRQRCLWLCESLDNALMWAIKLDHRPLPVIRVRATGRALLVDEQYLGTSGETLPVWYDKARHYWAGDVTAAPLQEVLFEGTITVEAIERTLP